VPNAINRGSDRPAYRQIADRLRRAILNGELSAGEPVPSERALIDEYGTARGTVRQALGLLRSEGLIDVEHGRGAFVRQRPPIRRLPHDRFARRHRDTGNAAFQAEAEREGRSPTVQVLEVAPAEAPDEIAERLRLPSGARALTRRRRYLVDEEPVEVATSWLPWDRVETTAICEQNPGPGGIYARLEETGHELGRFTEEVSARMPLPDEARSLSIGPGVPIFRLLRTAFDGQDSPVEICDTVMAADRYVLSYELPAR
jgi:GntR family transcriptional regulator